MAATNATVAKAMLFICRWCGYTDDKKGNTTGVFWNLDYWALYLWSDEGLFFIPKLQNRIGYTYNTSMLGVPGISEVLLTLDPITTIPPTRENVSEMLSSQN